MSGAAETLLWLYRELARRGLNHGSSGNVSCRQGDALLITPTGATAESLRAEQMVALPLAGPPAPGSAPSSEWPMHAAVYAACPRAEWVVHCHADACTALACLNEGLPVFHYAVVGFGGSAGVPCAPYATFGTPALAATVTQTIPGHTACLLANHGMICHGRDAESALATAIRLETLARQYLLARAAGTPRLLSAEEVEQARQRYRTYGRPTPQAEDPA
ncbi:class II aldolase/adducin family protein [Pseudoroseomonas cervicalis]|uniref:class II aldolase/adducin family protein n=1 Tax=Teichococcus cervicalis TaxID=204525 RepID=UPI0022F152C8|nr:class II aldolase/adducin family protein [Pseudoroseomonas cervicalis]WBV45191.1 class II aldolase/adducin family protein [Pseudoroseomonas cervicalis]